MGLASLDAVYVMNPDHVLPAVSRLLQKQFLERFRAYRATTDYPLPKRRKRTKPFPGLHEAQEVEG
ncbi:MAG TPA: hypothetical protein VIO94_16045 [Phenylobacterium sp.]